MKKLVRGMVKDTSRADQPEGTMRDALNANLNITKGTVVNEHGTIGFSTMGNFQVLGNITLEDDKIVVFGHDTSEEESVDEIRQLDPKTGIMIVLYRTNALGFRETHPIVAISRKNQADEHLVYFTDGFSESKQAYPGFDYVSASNPPRVINITKQIKARQAGLNEDQLYNTTNTFHKLELVPRVGEHSKIDSARIITGGALKSGAYYLALAYADQDGLETNYFVMSNPVYIVPGEENSLPTNTLIGAEGGAPTNKSIQWQLLTPDAVDYQLIQPAVIRVINEEQTAFKLPPVQFDSKFTTVTFTGNEQSLPVSTEDILVDDVTYTSAEAIAQLDNRLYLGNVTSTKDIGFQPFASQIDIKVRTERKVQFNPRVFDTFILNQGYAAMLQTYNKPIGRQYFETFTRVEDGDNPTSYTPDGLNNASGSYAEVLKTLLSDNEGTRKGYRDVKFNFKKKSFRRGEVYAFYISFVLKDGTETYAYHIPGREARKFARDESIGEDDKFKTFSDSEVRAATGFRPEEFKLQNDEAHIYQVVDTASYTTGYEYGDMSFWENENEKYPNTSDFIVADVSGDGTPNIKPVTLAGENVRHHKFPSNLTSDISFVDRGVNNTTSHFQEVAERFSITGDSSGIMQANLAAGEDGGIRMSEAIRLMGIELENIKLPKYILEQVQGYKIYYAKRNKENRTVLGQGVAVPGHPRYASTKEQDLSAAIKGPYKRAFYMYGGLDHSDSSVIDTIGHWKSNSGTNVEKNYYAHPVFKIHDFNLLRNRDTLKAATHIQCQYGVMFRLYQGGPGTYVDPCQYDQIDRAVADAEGDAVYTQYDTNDVSLKDGHSTTFPSLGWVSPEMKNTVDFYWHDPMHLGATMNNTDKELFGVSRVLDISDVVEGVAGVFDSDGELDNDLKAAKRARRYRKGEDLSQPAENDGGYANDTEQLLAVKAKESRVRAWYTSVMVATAYIQPETVLSNPFVTKGGDFKGMGDPDNQQYNQINRFYDEQDFDNNQLTLTIEPTGKILLNGREDYESTDSASFKGASYLYNRGGETAHAISLTSGLPALRGHLPFDTGKAERLELDGYRTGLTTWGDGNRWLFPDAPIKGVPLWYQRFGESQEPGSYYGDQSPIQLYKPSEFRGLHYTLKMSNQYNGLPMAWMVNICSFRTEVYAPFDQQQLVWTGYYKDITNANTASGAALTDDTEVNYYLGASSGTIFGGDTYITRHGVRTTSQSYGHAYFRAAQNLRDPVSSAMITENDGVIQDENLGKYLLGATQSDGTLHEGEGITTKKNRFQGDIPAELNPNKHNKLGLTNNVPVWNYNSANATDASNTSDNREVAKRTLTVLKDSWNWVKGDVNPVSTIMYFYCESDDLIEFRHIKDTEAGQETKIFDYHTAASMLFDPPTEDYTKPDKILYGSHFSALQDLKVTQPLPVFAELEKENTFPRRIVRSDIDSGTLADGYRKFRGLNFKDVPSQRGAIKRLFDYRGTLYINTTRSLFITQGKEELKIGAATAFIGNGDIFTRDPAEVQESTVGYGGTTSRHAHVTTSFGHFYVNQNDRKIFMAGSQGLADISGGIQTWLRDNMPFVLEQYGIDLGSELAQQNGFYIDAPTGTSVPLGFTIGYDPKFERVLITKHEPVPTDQFVTDFNSGRIVISKGIPHAVPLDGQECLDPDDTSVEPDAYVRQQKGKDGGVEVFCGPIWFGNPLYFKQGGWTISYYPKERIWGSRHSYRPNMYGHTSKEMYSFAKGDFDREEDVFLSWEHSNSKNPGRFYGKVYNFEIEFIDNTAQKEPKIFSNFYYWAESYIDDGQHVYEINKVTNPVFDKFYAYNSTQITGINTTINYLNNARLVDRIWYVNDIRDYAKTEDITSGDLITNTENVAGYVTSTVTSHVQTEPMFEEEGVVNANYVDTAKEWYNRRKLIDHYLGVRLIHDNSNRNLVHLYAVGTKFRKSHR
jgi:hypothetical protein